MVTEWASFNASLYVQSRGKDIPPRSQSESEKPTNWEKVAEYADFLEKLHFEVEQARSSPQHFGVFIKMPDILGEPEDLVTFEEYKAQEWERKKARANQAKDNIFSIFAAAAERGASFQPAESAEQ